MAITGKNKTEDVETQEEAVVTVGSSVKNVVRWISKQNISNPDLGVWAVSEVDEYLNYLYTMGYHLFNTHYLGENPEGYGVLYVLVS